jgi:hypothetical protein
MALHVAAVEILIEKGRFEPEVALGIAEAIEASVTNAQFVTVPILDARLQEIKAEMRIAGMGLESNVNASIQALDVKIDLKFGELVTRIEQTKAELVRWVLLVMLANVALSAGLAAALNTFKSL